MDEVLLDVKLSVPLRRPGLVSRGALIDTLRTSGALAIGITAPAGYGKSSLLVEWARCDPRRVAWLSLDPVDDDPGALLFLLASAYERAVPEEEGLASGMSGLGVSALGRGAPRVAAMFQRAPAPFLLLLDDLHELRSPACHDVLAVVLSGIPDGSQVVTTSRAEQPHLPRLRAQGHAVELRAADLALDVRGAEEIFAAARVPITPEQALEVSERTEGWPVGLHLAAMIARDAPQEPWVVSGDDRYVAQYLQREALSTVDPRMHEFLRRTAVLERFNAPLCDAVVGEPGGRERLEALALSNSFLIPLDRTGDWYRYHPLFRDFLLGELRRSDPELVRHLHARAADWYQAHGSPAMAVEHLLSAADDDRCARLVADLVPAMYSAGQISTVQRWMSALGESAIRRHPPLAVLAGWITALVGDTPDAQRWADVVDEVTSDEVQEGGPASFASSRAMLRAMMCPAGPEQLMADAQLAAAAETPSSLWRDTALYSLAEAHLLAGDVEQAAVAFEDATSVGLALGHTDPIVSCQSELALLAMDAGRWEAAADRVTIALDIIEAHQLHDYAISVLAFAAAARLAVHRGDLVQADRHLTQGMRSRPLSTFVVPFLAVRGRLQLARVYTTRGDQAAARMLLREIDDILKHRPLLGALVDEVDEFRRLASGAAAARTGVSPLTSAELRLLPYLQTYLTIAEIAQRLQVTRNTVGTEVSAIYRKLGVSSRGEAVRRATTLGLLGG
jgi:LuxR family transcriptional regulator, maltose regulon positive regulatory protein